MVLRLESAKIGNNCCKMRYVSWREVGGEIGGEGEFILGWAHADFLQPVQLGVVLLP
jgi:hypothetical protein